MVVLGLFNSSFLNGLNVSIILFKVCIVILLSRVTRRLYHFSAVPSSGKTAFNPFLRMLSNSSAVMHPD